MTEPHEQTAGHVYGHAAPPAPGRKRKKSTWLLISAVTLGLLCFAGVITVGVVTLADTADDPGITVDPGDRPAEVADQPADNQEDDDPAFYEPKPGDFALSVKTLSKQCFGSAGCNVEFRIELAYSGRNLDPAITYELTYQVEGGESEYVNTLTLSGDEYSTEETEFISTPSDRELTVTVLDVTEL